MNTKIITATASAIGILSVSALIFIPGVPKPTDLPKAEAVAPASQLSVATIEKGTKGFKTGPVMANKKVYVFFDPSCPHCKDLWNASLVANRQDVSVSWIPVGVLNPQSVTAAAKLLSALPDNAKAIEMMKYHEQNFDKGGLTGDASTTNQFKGAVRLNSEMLTKYSTSIPFLVTEINGKVHTAKGGMTPQMWNAFVDTGATAKTGA